MLMDAKREQYETERAMEEKAMEARAALAEKVVEKLPGIPG